MHFLYVKNLKKNSIDFISNISPFSVPSLYQKWNDVYGVKMTTFAQELRASMGNKPEILTIRPEDLLGTEVILCWFEMKETSLEDLESFTIQHVLGWYLI